jgi:manganese/zinc/iron transport system ATP- binding protein
MAAPHAVEFHDLTVAYGGRPVLWNIDLAIDSPGIFGIIGPNGAGKSTLLKAALGLVPLAGGSVKLFGRPLDEVRRRVGYVPQRETVDWDFPVSVMDVARGQEGPFHWHSWPL